jgi:hypothetical protein
VWQQLLNAVRWLEELNKFSPLCTLRKLHDRWHIALGTGPASLQRLNIRINLQQRLILGWDATDCCAFAWPYFAEYCGSAVPHY